MNLFFKLLDERYTAGKSSIITTNLKYEKWYDILKPKAMVDARLDRLRHNCITISIEGDTLRQPKYLFPFRARREMGKFTQIRTGTKWVKNV